ncbi:hypothetical protein AUEXF2481DRAFT_34077 [Aureobasidium subglaciale EXF-2481]|uniref:Uncharacterized protein n=1 Tax=Aureobasidium subglaciale (strain EXF-2481) TaxID=1043005 RepID=A0A074YTW6_AURSE|nr:uncharacterized protein AUEXF2481DRAFT_34077 [Aureobasidium subglaciale EXF-2481]KAI5195238.1 hypothetical protein E4T38_09181 [Aureobasidium subglaciale]KAI5214305.1 hypothetical protein E4T40_09095 [Aureobasidium subglaciale]KAI5216846.1 hypothetical protein E4T41_09096 [Aureobasidium subglaciale]KAI5254714.1 hypothetical protein E4T46_09088 [Aureobasidium subglaciale]KEQ90296.1 hypothetical protein AUEXF2481DRAFT_34077 [Aureobasidium subglaciale EXF-2481]
MAGLRHLIPGLVLSLGSSVSASPLAVLPLNATYTNVTSNPQFSNYTSTKTVLSTATIYNAASTDVVVVAAIGGHQASSSGISAGAAHGPGSSAASAVVIHGGSQSQAPVNSGAFQTIVVTQTVAGCSLGGPLGTPSSTGNHAPFAVALSSTAKYAAATVQPAVHWDYPLDDLNNLIPSRNTSLYYGLADPKVEHSFASVVTDMTHDAVILDHSSYISSTSCSEEGILVSFTTTQAFNLACDSWSSISTGLVLATYTDGCHGDSEDQRTFWLIASLSFDNKTLTIKAIVSDELDIGELFHEVDLVWGTYTPGSSGVPAISGTASSQAPKGGSYSTLSGNAGASATASGAVPTRTSSGNNTLYGSSCGAAPSSVIDGLPAIDCGDADFDARLDDRIGYLDTTDNFASSLENFLPEVDFDSDDLVNDEATLMRRDLGDFFRPVGNFLRKTGTVIKKTASVAVDVTIGTGKVALTSLRLVPVLGDVFDAATNGALSDLSDFNPSIQGVQEFNFGPQATVDSPWGKAASIYSEKKESKNKKAEASVDLYCVDCGVKGKVSMAGQAKWNGKDGLKALNAGINANIEAGVHLGLAVTASYKDKKEKKIINAPLPYVGVAVGKLFTAGVYISVDAKSSVEVDAEGQVLVGVAMKIPNFEAKLDLFNEQSASKSSITGFTPNFTRRFEASGKIGAKVSLSLPIAINAGIEIPPLSLKRVLALIEEPKVYGNLTVAASSADAEAASETCNNGIEYLANVQNDINLDFLGIKTFNLAHYDSPPLLKGCKKFDGSKATSKASSAASSQASTATIDRTAAKTTIATTGNTGPVSTSATTGASSAVSTGTQPTTTDDSEPSEPTNTEDPTATDGTDQEDPTETGEPSDPSATGSEDGPEPTETNAPEDETPTGTDSASTPDATEEPITEDSEPDNDKSASSADEQSGAEQLQRRHARSFLARRQDSTTSADDSENNDDSGSDQLYTLDDDENYTETFDNDVATEEELSDDAIGDYSEDPDNTAFLENTNKALALASVSESPTDANYTTLVDIQKTLAIVPSANGNLYIATYSEELVQSQTLLFGNYDDAVFGDDSGRLLHFHPDEMKVYGASRLRLSDDTGIPKSADFMTLVLQEVENNQSVYFGFDTTGNSYNIVMCNFVNDAVSKLFVVNGEEGLNALTSNANIKYTVTGGPVQDCYALALVNAV